MGSPLDMTIKLISSMYDYHRVLREYVNFMPRILTYQCLDCEEDVLRLSCILEGKYCLLRPRNEIYDFFVGFDEVLTMQENIRERCIYEVTEEEGRLYG
jgi:hypothetical protein